MAHLLDTNVCSAIIRAKDGEFADRALRNWPAAAISAITAHELEFWANNTGPRRALRIRWLLNQIEIRFFDAGAAAKAAGIRTVLLGKPLATYDALIAGHALALGFILVTDDADFKRVPGLRMENWLKV